MTEPNYLYYPSRKALDVEGAMEELLLFAGEHFREHLFEDGKGISVLWLEKLKDTMRRLYAAGQADREAAILADPQLYGLLNGEP